MTGHLTLRPRVYVAGPLSGSSEEKVRENCLRAINMGFVLMDAGYAPFVPHYSWFSDVQSACGKSRYEQWISLDLSWIAACHALLRLTGTSAGADREVEWAKTIGVPVCYTLEELFEVLPHAVH